MRLKPITGFTMLVLLFGVATSALQNSAFAQTSTNDLDGDYKKKIEKITKLKHEEKLKQVAKEKFAKEAKEKLRTDLKNNFKQESKEKLRQDAKGMFTQEAKEKLKQGTKEQFAQQAKEKLRPEIARPVCNPSDSDLARKELATMEQRYSEMKMKFYNEWQSLHESGEYDGPWEKFVEEKFLNSPETADLNHIREKYHQLMMRCSNAQQGVTEQDNYEEEITSYNDLTDELEDDFVLDDDMIEDIDEETILDDDLNELLTEIESISVPESIKDEAGWWADNQIEDSDFASSIEYLASQNVMQLAGPSGPDSHIPQWVKAIAGWWAEGKIPDKEFVNAVQFLVNHGIIKV